MKKELEERLIKFRDTNITFDIDYMIKHGYESIIIEIIKFIKMFYKDQLQIEIKLSDDQSLSYYMLVITNLSKSILFKDYSLTLNWRDKDIISIKMAYSKRILSFISVKRFDGEYGIFI